VDLAADYDVVVHCRRREHVAFGAAEAIRVLGAHVIVQRAELESVRILGDETLPTPAEVIGEATLLRIQDRVLWLATSMVHHANKVRLTRSGIKVGGHQASSASIVSIMTALYFAHLTSEDRVSVKPHASPVLHAINFLLGRLDRSYLTELRSYHGLQSYPSRTKDPDPVDFSTGSVGIGATATLWSALSQRFVSDRFGAPPGGRHIALVGDAELDEGAIWEALIDPMVPGLGNVLWIVDLNRQSLDRVVPDIAAGRIGKMFEAAGWNTVVVKYGRKLQALFDLPDGEALRERIDSMSNEEYQRVLRSPIPEVRERLLSDVRTGAVLRRLLADISDVEVADAVSDLGGHDLVELSRAIGAATAETARPSVLFAYTIKAKRLPTQGHPENHSALLSDVQWQRLAEVLGADAADPWAPLPDGSAEALACAAAAARLRRVSVEPTAHLPIPVDLGRRHSANSSTQQAFGRFFVDLRHQAPEVAERVVTVSPDVASSTNLGGWINSVGVWNPRDRADWFADDSGMLMRWSETRHGQHIELGIAEGNLVGLLAELGATWSRAGQQLLPIGTLYDPFVTRALEQWSFGIYAGGQSILVGTPSGVTLAAEGGAHQSVITPSIGIEQPQCDAWEPCFAQDLEWTLLHALGRLGRPGGRAAYFRLSTRPIDQSLAALPTNDAQREIRRRQAIEGGYVLRRAPTTPRVILVGTGVVIPEVLAAASELSQNGVESDVICLTSAGLVFRAMRARQGLDECPDSILDVLFPPERRAPMVTVVDGHPHTLAFLAAINGSITACLGVDDFGQVGDVEDLYRHFGIDADTIVGAAWDLLDRGASAPAAT
jgi:pyruvate dehydrogenase E1 component